MSEFTPGPWHLAEFDQAKPPYCRSVSLERLPDCSIQIVPQLNRDVPDAQLIAAAPDLLAAAVAQESLIQEALECEDCNFGSHCGTHHERWGQIQNERRAAIAKAKGEAA